jgi:tRNA1(Val) A37 N6-methylase TrmN6
MRMTHFGASLPQGAKVVDIGGGIGMFSLTLARTFSNLNMVVQDSLEVVTDSTGKQINCRSLTTNYTITTDSFGEMSFRKHYRPTRGGLAYRICYTTSIF